jgi:hypothetical protein
MVKPRDDRQKDLLRPVLEATIDLGHHWCGWRARSTGVFSTAGLPASARQCW